METELQKLTTVEVEIVDGRLIQVHCHMLIWVFEAIFLMFILIETAVNEQKSFYTQSEIIVNKPETFSRFGPQ